LALWNRGIESPAPRRCCSELAFATVRGAAALAFAIVLGFAAVGAGLAAALALATVLAFAAMLGRSTVVSELSGAHCRVIRARLSRLKADSSPAEQTGHGRTGEYHFRGILCVHMVVFIFWVVVLRLAVARAFDPPSHKGKSADKVLKMLFRLSFIGTKQE
jgi:hypothetical protein